MNLFIHLLFSFFFAANAPQAAKIDSVVQYVSHENLKLDYAILIDMSVSSNEKRLYLVQLDTKKVIYSTFVAHGKGSGHDVKAIVFSDVPGSLCTALGKYKVGKNYVGKHGSSYELIGLEKTNANAMDRAIVIHSAWYVEEDFIKKNSRCGNSWGCPAVSPEALEKLKPYLTENTVVWIYK